MINDDDDPLPPAARFSGIQCSTAHITEADNSLLFALSHQFEDFGESEWIHYSGSGYLIRLEGAFPVLRLKRLGLSKACRRLTVRFPRAVLAHRGTACVHFTLAGRVATGND
ncbi:DUF5983 family protein [Serratia nematodiphila]|uniref:DUF5983 family protein n=1 Tax=Serratia marcescens TaxID=615 RepID=UPI0037B782E5